MLGMVSDIACEIVFSQLFTQFFFKIQKLSQFKCAKNLTKMVLMSTSRALSRSRDTFPLLFRANEILILIIICAKTIEDFFPPRVQCSRKSYLIFDQS